MCVSDYPTNMFAISHPLSLVLLILFVALAHILWAEETASGVSSPLGYRI